MTYIIIVNYNTWFDTIECINSIFTSNDDDFKIIIIDNNSVNNSIISLLKYFKKYYNNDFIFISNYKALNINHIYNKKILLIHSHKNDGFSKGNNIGINIAFQDENCNYIWILNNDTIVFKDTLEKLKTKINSNKKIGILGIIQKYYNNPDRIQAIAGGFNKKNIKFFNITNINDLNNPDILYFVYGASMFFTKHCLMNIGFFNENFFIYYEEIDICERAKKKGFEIDIDLNNYILHKHGSTIKKNNEYFRKYYLERNKFLFLKRFNKKYYYLAIILFFKNIFIDLFHRNFNIIYIISFIDGCLLNKKGKNKYF